ncbi:P-loop NTPase fold protein [Cyclobacterium qasimii]|nr:P-loop NTPase fold protein [Cyclobacterium qasimii]EPR65651.1 KAP P-loop domain protein [Cyclobacterium qasimii M12-11B]
MDKDRIIESIDQYLKNPITDYAVLIKGEWGIGKTHFLKEEIYSLMKKSGFRPIYKSLIGLNPKTQLEKIILKEINPFLNSKSRSSVSIEAEFIESVVNGGEKPISKFPKNIVLCFDDLERMNPDFFESAMGVINIFIEHHNTKCIFVCNENQIENLFKNYIKIKEKYIRFTFDYNPFLESIILENIEGLEKKYKDSYNVSVILDVFKIGGTDNLRTLFFVLSTYQQVLVEIEELKIGIKHKTEILDLILTYICFYAIESKRGNSFTLLDKITIVNSDNNFRNFLDNEEYFDFDGEPIQTQDEHSNELAIIQNRYFQESSFKFERFESVAELIKTGFLNSELLKKDILSVNSTFEEIEIQERKDKVLKILDNIFELSDSEIKEK